MSPELNDALEDLLSGLAHQDFFSVEQCDDRVRALLHEFDQVGIDGDARVVEASELDHGDTAISTGDTGR